MRLRLFGVGLEESSIVSVGAHLRFDCGDLIMLSA